ncbi:MAG TPA: DUF1508 domain-containing protein [Pyrinomonadaceae bacterium]|nr:DUF1508 domain-containing protein [Pyrinomonadaceae bacterium]
MNATRETLDTQLEKYEARLRSLRCYVNELNDKTSKHGTEREHFHEDLLEAEHNVKYHEDEIARLRELIDAESGGTTYFVYHDSQSEWRWQLRAGNQRIIADSGEGYQHKQDCLHAIELVKNSKNAPVKEKS